MRSLRLISFTYLIPLFLGLCGFDAFAKAEDKRHVQQRIAAAGQTHYYPQINLGGFYGNNDSSYGMLDIMVPLAQRADRLLFINARGLLRKSPVNEVNLGVGYRWLNNTGDAMMGVYGYYDDKQSAQKLKYSQLTLGGEYKTSDWSFGSNVYLPLGKSKRDMSRANRSEAQAYQNDKFILLYGGNVVTEYALYGLDAEVGYTPPKLPELTAYLGGYYFKHSDSRTITGPRAALQYDVAPLLGKHFNWIGSLNLETSMQYDAVRNGIFYTGVRLSVPIGSQAKRPAGLQKAMTALVRRDLDVVTDTETTFNEKKVWTKPDGTPYVGKIVSDQAGIEAATTAGSGIDIIGVKGQVAITGPVYIDANTQAAVTLLKGQSITGLTYTFSAGGITYNTNIVNSGTGISGADPSITARGGLTLQGHNGDVGNLLRVYTADTPRVEQTTTQRIEDLVLRVPHAGSNAQQTSATITNSTGQVGAENNKHAFGNVVIDNVDSNGIIAFSTEANRTGQITVQNSQLSVTNAKTHYGVIDIRSITEADVNITGIRNNDIASSSGVGHAYGIYASWLNGPVTNNRFGAITTTAAGSDAIGIRVLNNLSGTVSYNTFSNINSADDDARGIYVHQDITGTVSHNTFTRINGETIATGITVFNDLSGTVSDNTFSSISATNDAYGIFADSHLSGTVSNNIFSRISAANTARGIYVGTDLRGRVSNNTFSSISATNNARGIYVRANLTGRVSNNTFSSINSTTAEAYGLYVGDTLNGTVSNNTFSNITGSSAAYGLYQENDGRTLTAVHINGNTFNVNADAPANSIGISIANGATTTEGIADLIANNTFGGNIGNSVDERAA